MSGTPDNGNYDSSQQGNYTPQGQSSPPLVKKYEEKIVANWQNIEKKVAPGDSFRKLLPSPPAFGQKGILHDAAETSSRMMPQKILEERMDQMLNETRENFLKEARALEKERLGKLETELKAQYELKISTMTAEYETKEKDFTESYGKIFYEQGQELDKKVKETELANRKVNIQAAILLKIHSADPTVLPKVLREANISNEDLEMLAGKQPID